MLALRLLFWNSPSLDALCDLAEAARPDLIILAGSDRSEVDVLSALNAAPSMRYSLTINRSERLQFFVAFSPSRFDSMHDGPGVAVRRVRPVLAPELLLVAVHLPSKLRLDEGDQAALATRLGRLIRRIEGRAGHSRTMVIGDLNMNPFEHGVVGSEGLHAVSSVRIAGRGSRTVQGESRDFFYNPMWSLLGDTSAGPPGTFYYAGSAPISYFWHMFDQVLFRPSLAQSYQSGDVVVLTAAGNRTLLDSQGAPSRDISDHLPIVATVRLPEVDDAEESLGQTSRGIQHSATGGHPQGTG